MTEAKDSVLKDSTLNLDQFAVHLREPDGGFSVSVQTGFSPKTGYMVSREGSEQRHAGTVQGSNLQDYLEQHGHLLNRRTRYFGGWRNPQPPGEASLDVSRRFKSKDIARASLVAETQDALYDLNKGKSEPNYLKLGIGGRPGMTASGYAQLRKAAKKHVRGELHPGAY